MHETLGQVARILPRLGSAVCTFRTSARRAFIRPMGRVRVSMPVRIGSISLSGLATSRGTSIGRACSLFITGPGLTRSGTGRVGTLLRGNRDLRGIVGVRCTDVTGVGQDGGLCPVVGDCFRPRMGRSRWSLFGAERVGVKGDRDCGGQRR